MYIGSEEWIPSHMFGAKDWFDHQNQSLDGLFTTREDTLRQSYSTSMNVAVLYVPPSKNPQVHVYMI